MARQREREVRGRDAVAVVGDPDQRPAAVGDGHVDPRGARVERVLDQLLDRRGRALDHLAGRDPVDGQRIERPDGPGTGIGTGGRRGVGMAPSVARPAPPGGGRGPRGATAWRLELGGGRAAGSGAAGSAGGGLGGRRAPDGGGRGGVQALGLAHHHEGQPPGVEELARHAGHVLARHRLHVGVAVDHVVGRQADHLHPHQDARDVGVAVEAQRVLARQVGLGARQLRVGDAVRREVRPDGLHHVDGLGHGAVRRGEGPEPQLRVVAGHQARCRCRRSAPASRAPRP